MLARWIEELSQYDMVIVHRKSVDHVNADARSRIQEDVSYCDCYHAGCRPEDLPCAVDGCLYCPRIHEQRARFEEEVEDVMPLAVRQVTVQLPTESAEESESRLSLAGDSSTQETVDEDSGSRLELAEDSDTGSSLTSKYTHEQLRLEQLLDDGLSLLIQWSKQPYGPFPEGEERRPSMAGLSDREWFIMIWWNHVLIVSSHSVCRECIASISRIRIHLYHLVQCANLPLAQGPTSPKITEGKEMWDSHSPSWRVT